MIKVRFPVRIILCLLVIIIGTGTECKGFTLPVGVILEANYSRVGKEQKVAIEVAAGMLNSSSSQILLISSASDLRISFPQQAQKLIRLGAKVIVSSGTWPEVVGVSDVTKSAKVPTVSLMPSTSIARPFLVEMSYPDIGLVNCLADLVNSYTWRRVIAVYEDDDYGTVSRTERLLAGVLQKAGVRLDYSVVFPPLDSVSDLKAVIRTELDRMREENLISTVYIILRSSENLTVSLFEEATARGMMDKGSVWICGPDVMTLLDSVLSPTFISSYMQGVIAIEPYVNMSTPEYGKFYSTFQRAFRNEYEKNGQTNFDPGVYAVRAYDVIHAVASAAEKARLSNSSLVNNLEMTNFTGLSGIIRRVVNGGMGKGNNSSTFRVLNVVGKSYKEIGFWVDGFGFYNEESRMNFLGSAIPQLEVVFWPGGLKVNPGGLRRLRVGVPSNPSPYGFIKVEYDNVTGNISSVSGFCFEVFTAAVSRLNYSIDYEFRAFRTERNSTYDDLLNHVYEKDIEILIGDITITSTRSEKVSFTEPFVSSGITMIIPMKNRNLSNLLTKPFTFELWITILALLLYNVAVIWYMEKHEPKAVEDFHGPWHKQLGATLWIIGTSIFQGYGDGIGTYYTKTVIFVWLLIVLILISCFTANLSSILVTEKLEPVIDKSKVGCDGTSFIVNYLERVLNFKPGNIVRVRVPDDFALSFENRSITAAFMESPYVRLFLSKYPNYATYGETQMLGGFGFALQKDDGLSADLSRGILALAEDGTIKSLESKWFSISLHSIGTAGNNIETKQSVGLGEFWTLFVFSMTISAITLVIFVVKKQISRRKMRNVTPMVPDQVANSEQDR